MQMEHSLNEIFFKIASHELKWRTQKKERRLSIPGLDLVQKHHI